MATLQDAKLPSLKDKLYKIPESVEKPEEPAEVKVENRKSRKTRKKG